MAVTKIEDNVVVSLAYTLTVDGQIVEEATEAEPLDYLHGAENIVPGLETALTGKTVGDKFTITLKPEDAYGEYDEDDKETFAKEDLPGAEMLEVGMEIVLEDEDGYEFEAIVAEISGNEVVLDFNPEYAGKTITYDVEVIALREANEEEIEHGHPHSYGYDDDDEDYDDEE